MWRNGTKTGKEEKRWKAGKTVLVRGTQQQNEMAFFKDCATHTVTSEKS